MSRFLHLFYSSLCEISRVIVMKCIDVAGSRGGDIKTSRSLSLIIRSRRVWVDVCSVPQNEVNYVKIALCVSKTVYWRLFDAEGWRLLYYIDHQFSRPLQCTSRQCRSAFTSFSFSPSPLFSLFNLHPTIPLLTDIHVLIYISFVTSVIIIL